MRWDAILTAATDNISRPPTETTTPIMGTAPWSRTVLGGTATATTLTWTDCICVENISHTPMESNGIHGTDIITHWSPRKSKFDQFSIFSPSVPEMWRRKLQKLTNRDLVYWWFYSNIIFYEQINHINLNLMASSLSFAGKKWISWWNNIVVVYELQLVYKMWDGSE